MSRNVNSRRSFIKAASIAGIAGLAGCSGQSTSNSGGSSESNGGTIHFLSAENSQAFKDYYQKWASLFEEEHDHTVELEFVGVGTSQSQRISKLIQSGDPPELTTTAPEKGGGLALQGVLADLSNEAEWMQNEWGYEFNEDFTFELQGSQYVVPIWVNMTMDWYRVSTWEENTGMTPSEITWSEFTQALADTHNVGERAGHVIPAGESLMSTEFYIDYMFSNGGNIFTREGEDIRLVMDEGENRQKTMEVLELFEEINEFSVDGSGYGYGQQIETYWSEQANETKYFGARPLQQAVANNEAVAEDTGLMHPPYKEEKLIKPSQRDGSCLRELTTKKALGSSSNSCLEGNHSSSCFISPRFTIYHHSQLQSTTTSSLIMSLLIHGLRRTIILPLVMLLRWSTQQRHLSVKLIRTTHWPLRYFRAVRLGT